MSRRVGAGAAGLAVAIALGAAGVAAWRGSGPPAVSAGAGGEAVPAPASGACAAPGLPECAKAPPQYATARGTIVDALRPVEFLKARCDGGDGFACVNLGTTYATGRGVAADPAAAAVLYRVACEERDVVAGCFNLAVLVDMGAVPSPNAPKEDALVELYERACRGGELVACTNLGVVAADSPRADRRAEAGPLLQHACTGGVVIACHDLGLVLLAVPDQAEAATSVFELACNASTPHAPACTALGVLATRAGRDGSAWFQAACAKGDASACGR